MVGRHRPKFQTFPKEERQTRLRGCTGKNGRYPTKFRRFLARAHEGKRLTQSANRLKLDRQRNSGAGLTVAYARATNIPCLSARRATKLFNHSGTAIKQLHWLAFGFVRRGQPSASGAERATAVPIELFADSLPIQVQFCQP